jgi:hypothetical protein
MVKKPKAQNLTAFLCDHYWLSREALPDCEDVFGTLRIAGDDCFDFMQELSEDFAIDLTNYDWSKYHFSEGEELDFIWPLRRLLGWRSIEGLELDRMLTPISAKHLEAVVRDRSWSDPTGSLAQSRRRMGGGYSLTNYAITMLIGTVLIALLMARRTTNCN